MIGSHNLLSASSSQLPTLTLSVNSVLDPIMNETSESVSEQPNINLLATTMFEKTASYLQEELAATVDDYRLLEEMNRQAITKYSDMKQIAANISKALKELNEKYRNLKPYLEQIDEVEESVFKLEQAAYKLDAYSKRLEAKFKQLEKR
ncbi:biogenesis of lysosome-related organelles complex 1 subunit 2 isoform X1 [Tachypleus tridentatus]|uniref:biogenesis of lysosome-related organelles complex 1 subunit 2 isoform X1 n=2 Tax=Tachypleus tridentatus TaxID=6853 RepID=UPI003FD68AB8